MVPSKFATAIIPRARARISHLTSVENAPWMQDWPVEVADAKRVGEFLHIYKTEVLDNEEKRALMALIICSFDEDSKEDEGNWNQLQQILVAEAKLHAGLIVYWSCVVEGEDGNWHFEPDEHCFHITPRMRTVLATVRSVKKGPARE